MALNSYWQQMIDQWDNIEEADYDTSPYKLIDYVGDMDPARYDVYEGDGPSTYDEGNSEAKQAQLDTLRQLQLIGKQGFTGEDQALSNRLLREALRASKASQQGIGDAFNARGTGGSGTELATRLMSNSNAATLAADYASDMFDQSMDRRLQGTQAAAGVASNIRETDANIGFNNANILNKFNENIMNFNNQARQFNASEVNKASMFNKQQQQGVEQANADITNQSQDNLNKLRQQQWQNTLDIATGKNLALGAAAQSEDRRDMFDTEMGYRDKWNDQDISFRRETLDKQDQWNQRDYDFKYDTLDRQDLWNEREFGYKYDAMDQQDRWNEREYDFKDRSLGFQDLWFNQELDYKNRNLQYEDLWHNNEMNFKNNYLGYQDKWNVEDNDLRWRLGQLSSDTSKYSIDQQTMLAREAAKAAREAAEDQEFWKWMGLGKDVVTNLPEISNGLGDIWDWVGGDDLWDWGGDLVDDVWDWGSDLVGDLFDWF